VFEPEPFGKYFLLDRIAVGGMAEIFRARTYGHGGFEKELVIKRILSHLTENEEFVQMFIEEAKLTVLLQHPNIVQVYDFGMIRDHYFLAMEGPYGRDLKTVLGTLEEADAELPLKFAALITHEVARGLSYAHTKRDEMGSPLEIVHRDVSPSNLFISWDGQCKLLDFGIAKASKSTFENTEQGVLKGKFEYMSPEQAQGLTVDHRSDIFSCGICLWEMVTGKRLFKSDTPVLTLTRIKAGEVPLVRQENPDVPKALADIIHRCLAFQPEDRYQSADELRHDLEAFLQPSTTNELAGELADWMSACFRVEMELERIHLEEARKKASVLATMEDTLELDLILDEDDEEVDSEDEDTIDDEPAVLGPGTGSGVTPMPGPAPPDVPTKRSPLLLLGGLGLLAVIAVLAVAAVIVLPGLLGTTTPADDPTPAVTHGILLVDIDPPEAADAEVLLDGVPIQIPKSDLTPGEEYALFVGKEGFLPFEDTFTVQAGERYRVKAILQPDLTEDATEAVTEQVEPATPEPPTAAPIDESPAIIWTSSPRNASVVIDGQTVGRTPYRMERGSPGQAYRATFKLDGYQDAGASGTFPSQGTITVRAALEAIPTPSEPGYLTINATPWADVYLNGRSVGQTPIGSLEVEPGSYTVRLVCPPLEAEKTINVTVAAGERKPVTADLEE